MNILKYTDSIKKYFADRFKVPATVKSRINQSKNLEAPEIIFHSSNLAENDAERKRDKNCTK